MFQGSSEGVVTGEKQSHEGAQWHDAACTAGVLVGRWVRGGGRAHKRFGQANVGSRGLLQGLVAGNSDCQHHHPHSRKRILMNGRQPVMGRGVAD